ncbi:PH domain-containing protein [Paenibacillus campinasensis]|uniref:PH domain-containing protein n=1 Tax=Paenibacillus campinasensis TaxID=66347 RepID=A0ABW9T1L3_9BACL|nr:PH domain-containing protein [Paenibacillus campinasensis]MUG67178.1 PH domain-containing protein [Paenibacillus campinasensis]
MHHRLEHMNRCHPDYVTTSRIAGLIGEGVIMLAAVAYLIIASRIGWTLIPGWIVLGLSLPSLWFTWYIPSFTYKHFGFMVTDEQLELRSGWLWLSDTLVPMTRIQHVELESGPLLRKYGLAKIKVVTAATTHVIEALKLEEAEALKKRIGELAKVVEYDE